MKAVIKDVDLGIFPIYKFAIVPNIAVALVKRDYVGHFFVFFGNYGLDYIIDKLRLNKKMLPRHL